VAPLRLFEGVDLVDDHRPHLADALARPEGVVDALVGADDHVGVGVEPGRVAAHAARPDPDGHVEVVAVAVGERLGLLVRERDEGNEKEQLPLAPERPVDAGEFADEGLPRRRRAHDELVVALHHPGLDGAGLDGQELLEPPPGRLAHRRVEVQVRDRDG
jgi:hypothetical protein